MYKKCVLCNAKSLHKGNWSKRPGNTSMTNLSKIRITDYPNGEKNTKMSEIHLCIKCFETKLEPWIKGVTIERKRFIG